MKLTEQQWRERLSDDQFYVTRQKGTEYPYSGALLHNAATGQYHCVCCLIQPLNLIQVAAGHRFPVPLPVRCIISRI